MHVLTTAPYSLPHRYADQMAHRLLAAIIQWEAVPREALDTSAATELIDNLNQRHTLAQHAGRASVALHTLIFFRSKATEEDAYVIKVRENGVVVLVPRYGIEGIVYVAARGERSAFAYDAKTDALIAPGCTLRTFDKVRVAISVDQSRAHRPKLQLAIIEPVLPRA